VIPVVPQPEPEIFDKLVRTPGEKFLKSLMTQNQQPNNGRIKITGNIFGSNYTVLTREYVHTVHIGFYVAQAFQMLITSYPNQ